MNNLFQELIQISFGKQDAFSLNPTQEEWSELYAEAEKQSLVGFCFWGIERLPKGQLPKVELLMDWLGQTEFIKCHNELVSKRVAEVTRLFADGGSKSIILKGQGVSMLYPHPESRTPGDIDIWVDGNREDIIAFLKSNGYKIGDVFVHHIDVTIFEDVMVEVHVHPSYTFNPFRWQKYKKWFNYQANSQFQLFDNTVGFAYPSIGFNLVYSLLHIFRHVFHEGIGLRQLLDYYFILQHSDENLRREAMNTLRWMGLERFTSAIMYVEQTAFKIGDEYLLCKPDSESGLFLLEEIIKNGNFGKYNKQTRIAHQKGLLRLYFNNVERLFKMIKYYPSEVLWSPIWKPAHFIWRKLNGY